MFSSYTRCSGKPEEAGMAPGEEKVAPAVGTGKAAGKAETAAG
jgi:hypothetical protein